MTQTSIRPWQVTQDDLVRYAGAARDFNDIHYDSTAAAAYGFAGPIAQGMFTLGRLIGAILDNVGLTAVSSIACRFTAPAVVGARLSFDIRESPEGLSASVCDENGRIVLDAIVGLGATPSAVPADGAVVADRALVVERGPAMRFAETVGAQVPELFDAAAAKAAGHPAIPVFPTFAFALPGWGWFADLPGNRAGAAPDAVRDCQHWAETTSAVVHAGQRFDIIRPLYVGEEVRALSRITGRSTKRTAGRVLRFTDVATVFTDQTNAHVVTSTMSLVVQEPTTQEEL